jgi:hypothetical protein
VKIASPGLMTFINNPKNTFTICLNDSTHSVESSIFIIIIISFFNVMLYYGVEDMGGGHAANDHGQDLNPGRCVQE